MYGAALHSQAGHSNNCARAHNGNNKTTTTTPTPKCVSIEKIKTSHSNGHFCVILHYLYACTISMMRIIAILTGITMYNCDGENVESSCGVILVMWSNLVQNADAFCVLVIRTRILKGVYDESLLYIKGDQMSSLLTRSDIENN